MPSCPYNANTDECKDLWHQGNGQDDMTNRQMDLKTFSQWLRESHTPGKLKIALKKLIEIDDPVAASEAFGSFVLGVWSGWSM